MEAGQGVGLIKDISSIKELMDRLLVEVDSSYKKIRTIAHG